MGRKAHEFKTGDTVFVRSDEEAWTRGEVVGSDGKTIQVKTKFGTVKCKSSEAEYCSTTPAQEAKVEDMTQLPDLHRPALLSSLHERFKKDKIYTYCGKILIALNPFKKLKLYDPKTMSMYMDADVGQRELLPPHAYAVAHDAFDAMMTYSGRNQSILVSGESGAGKTVSTKIVMDYLTTVSSRSRRNDDSSISQRTLEANPLMEAFGNAKTLRNDNSSRFGKLIQLQFSNSTSALESASIDIYLLEKARVVHQIKGERNYHIFYELDKGLSDGEKRDLLFPKLSDCRYTSSGTYKRADIGDKKQFKETLKAMDTIGVTKEERDSIFRMIVAILHLGNVQFDPANKDGAEGSKVSKKTRDSLEACAQLLYIKPEALEEGLVTRPLSVGGGAFAALANLARATEALTKQHTPDQAAEARDAMAMGLYDRLFGWITWRINESIGQVSGGTRPKSGKLGALQKSMGKGQYYNDYSIGCLDIFGFEVFEKNSFEQLLINYANESLQGQFNNFVFEREQKEYVEEGIDWTKVEFPDNKRCLEMIEAKPIGMISLIDEECLMPRGTDKTLAGKLYDNLGRNYKDYFIAERQEKVNNQFIVNHFAGAVIYTVDGFCMKNKNELRQGIVDCMRTSKNPLFQILLPPDAGSAGGGADSAEYFSQMNKRKSKRNYRSSLERRRQIPTSKLQQKTVASHFKTQLSVAMTHIRASQPHYIRCIKSTDLNVPDVFDRPRVEEQLSYAGVLEVVRVARAGYATRFSHAEFASRFAVLAHKSVRSAAAKAAKVVQRGDKKSLREECEKILVNTGLEFGEDYQVGKTKVFLRSHAYTQLEVAKADRVRKYVIILQRAIRAFLVYNRKHKKEREERRRKEEERKRRSMERREKLRKEEEERKRRSVARKEQLRLEEERRQEELRKEEERIRKEEERIRQEEERLRREEEELQRILEEERLELERQEKERKIREEEERKKREEEERIRLEHERQKEQIRLQEEQLLKKEKKLKEIEARQRKEAEKVNKLRAKREKEEEERRLAEAKRIADLEEKRRRAHEKREQERRQRRENLEEQKRRLHEERSMMESRMRQEIDTRKAATLGRKKANRERRAATNIQRIVRGVLARKKVSKMIKKRRSAARAIRKAYQRKIMRDRLREIREQSVRQRAAIMLQGLARTVKAQRVVQNLYAEQVADVTARQLQAVARTIAIRKTEEMMEQEDEAQYRTGEDSEVGQAAVILLPILVLYLFSNPFVMFALIAVVLAMLFGAGMGMEANMRQKELQEHAASYSKRLKANRRGKSKNSRRSSDSDDDYIYNEVDDDADLQFFEKQKTSSRVLTKQLSRKKTQRPASSKMKKTDTNLSAFDDYDYFYGSSSKNKKGGRATKTSSSRKLGSRFHRNAEKDRSRRY